MKYLVLIFFNILLFSQLFAQNYYESLGDYNFELISKVDKTNKYLTLYDCDLLVYDKNKSLVDTKYFFLRGNNYEMKKFLINKNTGEEAIFILGINLGANTIWGTLKCIIIKRINISSYYIEIPVIIDYSDGMNLEMIPGDENPKLVDVVKDIDDDGVIEFVDNKAVLIGPAGKITASWVTVISKLEEDKFVCVNDKYEKYLTTEIQTLVDQAKQTKINCNEKDEFTKIASENLLGSIVISHALINQLDEGLRIFHSLYKCPDADILEKRILIYYYDEILKNFKL